MTEDVQELAVKERPTRDSGQLTGQVQPVGELAAEDRNRMFSLFSHYFRNAKRSQFEHDLGEKEGCVLLRDGVSGEIQGFSTFLRLKTVVDGEQLVGIFSGDTIIEKEYWGETELFRIWGKHMYELSERMPYANVYWLLITSGYKTYRFLPIFFHEFYPTYQRTTPTSMNRRLNALIRHKFPTEYDAQSGIVRLACATPLHEGVADVTARRLKDPHVAYFVHANPGYTQEDNLACLAKIDYANLTSAGRRILGR